MGLFANTRAWLGAQAQVAAGVSVTYTRGAESLTLTALPGQTAFRVDSEGGARVEVGDRDYLIEAADLSSLGVPRVGDRVTETIDGTACVFEVRDPDNGEPAWRYDPQRVRYRLHTKRVA